MISTCAQNDPNQTLQDLILIKRTQTKINISRFASWRRSSSFIHLLNPSLGSLGPSWRPCCSPKASFGVPWRSLGASWLPLEHILALWGPPWPSQNLLWLPLRSPLASSGLLWALLGVSSFMLEAPWAILISFLDPLGAFWCLLGQFWSASVSKIKKTAPRTGQEQTKSLC